MEKSSYKFISKPNFQTRLKEFNLPAPRQDNQSPEANILEWKAQGISARKSEPYSPPAREIVTMVEIAPRTQKVVITRGFYDEDEITYIVPATFKPEYLPEAFSLENEFSY